MNTQKKALGLAMLSYSDGGCQCRLNKGGILFRRTRYQQGNLTLEERKRGPAVWVYRWWERDINGKRTRRKVQIGTLEQYPNESKAQAAADALRLTINHQPRRNEPPHASVNVLWEHYSTEELPLKEISTQDVTSTPWCTVQSTTTSTRFSFHWVATGPPVTSPASPALLPLRETRPPNNDARLVPPPAAESTSLESMEIVVALILMAVCWFAWYVARERYYLENTPNCRIGVLPDPNRARHHRSLYPYY